MITTFYVIILKNPANIIDIFNQDFLTNYTPDLFKMKVNEMMIRYSKSWI